MNCKKCGQPIDKLTIDFFQKKSIQKKKPGAKPRICGPCLAAAIFDLLGESIEEISSKLTDTKG